MDSNNTQQNDQQTLTTDSCLSRRQLSPQRIEIIKQQAAYVVHTYSNQAARDFADDAISVVWEKLEKFNPDKATGGFAGWCRKVLRGEWIDRHRRTTSAARWLGQQCSFSNNEQLFEAEIAPTDLLKQFQMQLDWYDAFSERDMATIRSWKPGQTVTLLVGSHLWVKLLANEPSRLFWEDMLAQYNIAEFPTQTMKYEDDHLHRLRLLASVSGKTFDTLRKYFQRNEMLLRQLAFVKQL